jgi:hypothetical protein
VSFVPQAALSVTSPRPCAHAVSSLRALHYYRSRSVNLFFTETPNNFRYIYSVKVAATIFSLYIIILGIYPCCDQQVFTDNASKKEITVSNHHPLLDRTLDLCSPFCICNCCRATVQLPIYVTFNFNNPVFAEPQSALPLDFIKSVPNSIWQPPKLG